MPSLKKFFLIELEENMHVLRFVTLYAAYSILSILLFFFTSGGWHTLAWMLYGWIPYTIVLVILFIMAVAQRRAGRIWVSIQKKDFAFLVTVQFLLLLLNPGDCGDGPGSYLFIHRLITRDVCTIEIGMSPLYSVFIMLLWVYVAAVIMSFFTPLIEATKEPKTRIRAIPLLYLFLSLPVLICITILFSSIG